MATKKPVRRTQPKAADAGPEDPMYPGERELVVVAQSDFKLRRTREGIASAVGADVTALAEMLQEEEGVTLTPLFGVSEERLEREAAEAAETGLELPDLSVFYRVEAPDERLDHLAECFCDQEGIEAAFVKPPATPAMWQMEVPQVSDTAPPATPSFVSRQGYLTAATAGIDAQFAWTVPGGSGAGVRIIDIEGAWRFSHEDLIVNQGGVVGGTPTSDLAWRNHGTAVLGEISGDRNHSGVTGICPDATVMGVSIFGMGSAAAIRHAAGRLHAGDVILIELHRPGPRFNFTSPSGQRGFIAIEWWPDDFRAIQYATSRGIIVIEAAGNGAENLNDSIYDNAPGPPHGPFPSWWVNPFRRNPLDSRACIVGAGAPPPGTHGRNHGPDRSRLGFSNHGSNVDAQGWGREVTTTGGRSYSAGDLQGGLNEDAWYSDTFSGTSSASPIVVGAVGCVQGILRAAGASLLTPATARNLLRGTGSPQQDAPGRPRSERIGNRPDLRAMVARVLPRRTTVPLYRYWNPRIGDHFYTVNWHELGHGRYGYRFEGVEAQVWRRRTPGTVPVFRYWNPRIGDHFYTTNWRELGRGRSGYRLEGIQCYVRPARVAGTVPLFRYWNSRIGDHFYTTNWRELSRGRYGYRFEGIQYYVEPAHVRVPEVPELVAAAPEVEEPLIAEPEPVAEATLELALESGEVGELVLAGDLAPEGFELEAEAGEEAVPLATSFVEAKGDVGGYAESFLTSLAGSDSFQATDEGSFAAEVTDTFARDRTEGNGHVAITINVEGEHPRVVTP